MSGSLSHDIIYASDDLIFLFSFLILDVVYTLSSIFI